MELKVNENSFHERERKGREGKTGNAENRKSNKVSESESVRDREREREGIKNGGNVKK